MVLQGLPSLHHLDLSWHAGGSAQRGHGRDQGHQDSGFHRPFIHSFICSAFTVPRCPPGISTKRTSLLTHTYCMPGTGNPRKVRLRSFSLRLLHFLTISPSLALLTAPPSPQLGGRRAMPHPSSTHHLQAKAVWSYRVVLLPCSPSEEPPAPGLRTPIHTSLP